MLHSEAVQLYFVRVYAFVRPFFLGDENLQWLPVPSLHSPVPYKDPTELAGLAKNRQILQKTLPGSNVNSAADDITWTINCGSAGVLITALFADSTPTNDANDANFDVESITLAGTELQWDPNKTVGGTEEFRDFIIFKHAKMNITIFLNNLLEKSLALATHLGAEKNKLKLQAMLNRGDKEVPSPELHVIPEYIEHFGNQDDQSWRDDLFMSLDDIPVN